MKLVIISTLLFILSAVSYFYLNVTEHGCEVSGGLYASNGNYCIRQSCYKNSSCGKRYAPGAYCKNVKIGNDISEVYMHLGQADSVVGDRHIWRDGPEADRVFYGLFENSVLTELSCK